MRAFLCLCVVFEIRQSTLVKEVSGISMNDLKAGVTIDEIVFTDSDVFTFAFSIDQTLVPEPSTYAAIFGVLALGFVICRRRKQYKLLQIVHQKLPKFGGFLWLCKFNRLQKTEQFGLFLRLCAKKCPFY